MVSKTFKKCFDRNQDIAKRLRPQFVDEYAHHFAPESIFDESVNKTFVLHPKGTPLVQSIQALGKGVIEHTKFRKCVNDPRLSSGDRILIQDGCYPMKMIWDIHEDIEVIGLGDCAEIHLTSNHCLISTRNRRQCRKVLLKNIFIKCEAHAPLGMLTFDDSVIWMDNVTLHRFGTIKARTVHAKSCNFVAKESIHSAISIWGKDTYTWSNIIGCTFDEHREYIKSDTPRRIRCIGNVFPSNKQISLGQHADQSIFKGNVYQGRIVEDC